MIPTAERKRDEKHWNIPENIKEGTTKQVGEVDWQYDQIHLTLGR